MKTLTDAEIEVVRLQLKRLEHARNKLDDIASAARLMGNDTLADGIRKHLYQVAQGEGEIEQAVFGARGAS